ncbi:Holliday junction ATP-dependent DNA helicase RuvA [Desulfosarcina alkanivorans]|uniref:Holliday junction branch migration complex subunit RuvA n=1 Tax=Desulfosarcina alkanivorans TaxID=571177 RepID=A0A5K7YRK2_9BACT|nr:Holliday junction branch migration protein RuvA [Desulfosarcina alkanivorans]BBO72432.1 Holliday junction ATP-dependent DNA helicase RuvA [Desulfosarcina alkanivorans]
MIGYLEGRLMKKEQDRILLLVNQVGYEVLVPVVVMETLAPKAIGDEVSLYIYYYQTERQPKPVLIGFNLEAEKEFFQYFISVEAIGPIKAVKALNISVGDIAHAIESGDVKTLKQLSGIGARTAHKIVASLQGKMNRFALIRHETDGRPAPVDEDFVQMVMDVLVSQLGYKTTDARQMIADAVKRDSAISTAEQLFDEIYRGQRQ